MITSTLITFNLRRLRLIFAHSPVRNIDFPLYMDYIYILDKANTWIGQFGIGNNQLNNSYIGHLHKIYQGNGAICTTCFSPI